MKRRSVLLVAVFYIVSWEVSKGYEATACPGKTPENIVCVKVIPTRMEKTFDTAEEADMFRAAKEADGPPVRDMRMEEVHL